jgi:hypothetical protein
MFAQFSVTKTTESLEDVVGGFLAVVKAIYLERATFTTTNNLKLPCEKV